MSIRSPLALVALLAACAQAPTYLEGHGYVADREATLGWVLLAIACVVVVVIAVLVLAATFGRRAAGAELMREGGGLRWIVIGAVIVPSVILLGTMIYSTAVLARVAQPAAKPPIVVQVIGHRWWWEVRYPGAAPSDAFATANEIHIPVRVPVQLELSTADVIHSFWIPQLAGKTDLIPGQTNVTWIEADTAGSYWGQCGEYCGLQHAGMHMSVVADSPAGFTRWEEAQRRVAATPVADLAVEGQKVFQGSACAVCHAVRGTDAGGAVGPDLTHIGSRAMLAAGVLPNTHGNLAGWIANPQGIKPGVIMPAVPLRPEDLHAVVAYLQSLK
ncbi:MAG: cytochrome c oxidase subunit II [Gemmatimonadales bacterium]